MKNNICFIDPNTDKSKEEAFVKFLVQAAINRLKMDKHKKNIAS